MLKCISRPKTEPGPGWDHSLANQNLHNLHTPVNAVLDQKQGLSRQPVHTRAASSGLGCLLLSCFLLIASKLDCVAPANHTFSIFLFLVLLYSIKAVCPYHIIQFSDGDLLLHEALNKVCLYHINFLSHFQHQKHTGYIT